MAKKGGHRRKSKATLLQLGEGVVVLLGAAGTVMQAKAQIDYFGGVGNYVSHLRDQAGGAPGKGKILGTEAAKTLAPLAEAGLLVIGIEGVKFLAEEIPGGRTGVRAIHEVKVKGHRVI